MLYTYIPLKTYYIWHLESCQITFIILRRHTYHIPNGKTRPVTLRGCTVVFILEENVAIHLAMK